MQTTQGTQRHWCHNIVGNVMRSHVGNPDTCGCWDQIDTQPDFTDHETMVMVGAIMDRLQDARHRVIDGKDSQNTRPAADGYLVILRKLRPESADYFCAKYGTPYRWKVGVEPCIYGDCTTPRANGRLHCADHTALLAKKGA